MSAESRPTVGRTARDGPDRWEGAEFHRFSLFYSQCHFGSTGRASVPVPPGLGREVELLLLNKRAEVQDELLTTMPPTQTAMGNWHLSDLSVRRRQFSKSHLGSRRRRKRRLQASQTVRDEANK